MVYVPPYGVHVLPLTWVGSKVSMKCIGTIGALPLISESSHDVPSNSVTGSRVGSAVGRRSSSAVFGPVDGLHAASTAAQRIASTSCRVCRIVFSLVDKIAHYFIDA